VLLELRVVFLLVTKLISVNTLDAFIMNFNLLGRVAHVLSLTFIRAGYLIVERVEHVVRLDIPGQVLRLEDIGEVVDGGTRWCGLSVLVEHI